MNSDLQARMQPHGAAVKLHAAACMNVQLHAGTSRCTQPLAAAWRRMALRCIVQREYRAGPCC